MLLLVLGDRGIRAQVRECLADDRWVIWCAAASSALQRAGGTESGAVATAYEEYCQLQLDHLIAEAEAEAAHLLADRRAARNLWRVYRAALGDSGSDSSSSGV